MVVLTGTLWTDVLAIITALITIGYAYSKWCYQYWRTRNMPYFDPSIPFGNLENPLTTKYHFAKQVQLLYQRAKTKGLSHFGMYFFLKPAYVPVDLELVKCVMAKDFAHFVDRGLYTNEKDDPIGCHLFAVGGAKWRYLRTRLTPAFTSGKLKAMFQTLVDCGLIFEDYIETLSNKKEAVDIKDALGCFSTDIIGSCAFGLECNSFKNPDSPFRTYGKQLFAGPSKLKTLYLQFLMEYPKIAHLLGLRQVEKDISDFFTKIVVDTVNYRLENKYVRHDLLQLLINILDINTERRQAISDGETLTLTEIVAQCFIFFIAGFETSSTTMTFALFELASHPEIQEKVREEIKTVLAKHDNEITYDSLNELKYMSQVIDETLRKYPPLAILTRQCVEDYKVPGENVIIEKGTRVIIPVSGIHYDEEFYRNPEVFDPERFSEQNKRNRNQYAHLPFGEGPRNCIGLRFGVMQTKVGLTCLLRNYKVKLSKKTELPLEISTKTFVTTAENGVWLDIEKA